VYLVIARCTLDDVPIYLSQTREAAEDEMNGLTLADIDRAATLCNFPDPTQCIAVDVVEFTRNGRPTGVVASRDGEELLPPEPDPPK
jgi:hypothetical protein